jgi:hypothetical protein
MSKLFALPSPKNTNRERLFSDAAWLAPRGPAYDNVNGLGGPASSSQPEASKADQVAGHIVGTLSQDELEELGRAVCKARDAKYGAAQDDAILDPYATTAKPASAIKREKNSGGAMDSKRRKAMAADAKWTSALTGAFARPGSKTYDRIERRKIAADAAVKKSLIERYPDIARIGIEAPQVDPSAGPHSMATDGRLNRSLEERYPQLKKIGFAY